MTHDEIIAICFSFLGFLLFLRFLYIMDEGS